MHVGAFVFAPRCHDTSSQRTRTTYPIAIITKRSIAPFVMARGIASERARVNSRLFGWLLLRDGARFGHLLVRGADVIATALEALDHMRMVHEGRDHHVARTVLLDGADPLEHRQPALDRRARHAESARKRGGVRRSPLHGVLDHLAQDDE